MANTALKKIVTRAKQLQKKHPASKWTSLIKKAGAEYRNGSLGSAVTRQTGTSNKKADLQRKAKKPGKRKSASGRVYTERRKNRSDKPGMLTGMKAAVKQKLADACLRYELADTVKATKKAQADKVKYRKILKAL